MRRAVPDVEVAQNVGASSLSRRALLGAGAAGAVITVPVVGRLLRVGDALGTPSKAQDVKILQLVLQVEYTQVAFYEEALAQAQLSGAVREFAQTALGHERQHLAAIKKALGAKVGAQPRFAFGDKTKKPPLTHPRSPTGFSSNAST